MKDILDFIWKNRDLALATVGDEGFSDYHTTCFSGVRTTFARVCNVFDIQKLY